MSVSLDGFVAGPDQSFDHPLGVGGQLLHTWHMPGREHNEVDQRWTARLMRPRGAYLMGRNMFGPVRGPWESWDGDWTGWWGDEPPYHAPVVVLTHHEHEPIEMEGGTTFHFVTGGFAEGLAQARKAGDGDVDISGGASVVRQAFEAGELDELTIDVAPVLLGSGERMFPVGGQTRLEIVEAEHSPEATHIRYRVLR